MSAFIIALFDDRYTAAEAVRDLNDHGYGRDQIDIISGGPRANMNAIDPHEATEQAVVRGAGIGVAVGAAGGLIASLAALTIPGIGPVLAAGPIVAMIIGATGGAIAGGFVGGLIDLGIPEHHAHAFAEGVRRGGTLVGVRVSDGHADEVADVLRRHDVVDLDARMRDWRADGWIAADETRRMISVVVIRKVTVQSLPSNLHNQPWKV